MWLVPAPASVATLYSARCRAFGDAAAATGFAVKADSEVRNCEFHLTPDRSSDGTNEPQSHGRVHFNFGWAGLIVP